MARAPGLRPLNVAGLRIIPKWDWSDDYRKYVAAHHRYISKRPWLAGDADLKTWATWRYADHLFPVEPKATGCRIEGVVIVDEPRGVFLELRLQDFLPNDPRYPTWGVKDMGSIRKLHFAAPIWLWPGYAPAEAIDESKYAPAEKPVSHPTC